MASAYHPKKIQEKKSNVGTLLTKLRNKRRATKQSKCEKTEGEEMKKRNAIVKNREGKIKSAGTVTSGAIEGKAGRMAGKRRGNLCRNQRRDGNRWNVGLHSEITTASC